MTRATGFRVSPRSQSRRSLLTGGAVLFAACGLIAGPGLASGDYAPTKVYSLVQEDLDNTVPFLAPTNDTRATVLMLLADAGQAHAHTPVNPDPDVPQGLYPGQTPLDLDTFAAVFNDRPVAPATSSDGSDDTGAGFVDGEGDLCRSNAAGSDGFLSALGSSHVPGAEQAVMAAARKALASNCGVDAGTAAALPDGAVRSAPGKEFSTYLAAAGAFYASDFASARDGFAALRDSRQAWLKEAARYMIARVDLNAAQTHAFGDYGELAFQNVDMGALMNAQLGFEAYLRAYPGGAYSASATGLLRRVAWLGGDHAKLADELGAAFTATDPKLRNVSVVDLAYEADSKLLMAVQPGEVHEPRLLAVLDLMNMRRDDGKPAPLSRADLEAQRPAFASQPELYAYLLAAYAYYDDNNPGAALKALAGKSAGPHMSWLQFSEQVLKGLALEATHDPAAARAQWLSLIPLAEPVLQRPAVELALAQNYEHGGDLLPVFAAGSPVRTPIYRERLLTYTAGPDLLRARATAADAVTHEKDLALFVLLFKELTRGRYQAFGDDAKLMPSAPAGEVVYDKLGEYDTNLPAVADFNWSGETAADGFACPSIRTVAAALAQNPHAGASLICLGEFLRIESYDGFLRPDTAASPSNTPATPPVFSLADLGSGPAQFPGAGIARLDIYTSIIADSKAAADVRAYALYRAVNCWAPSGYNGCDGADVPQSRRKAWYNELKSRYPKTAWAAKLKYYW